MATNTHYDGFSDDAFFIAVVTSEMLRRFPEQQQREIKWFLFNASEQTKKSFFKIFQEEQKMLSKFQKQEAKLAEEFLSEWKSVSTDMQVQMGKGIREIKEHLIHTEDEAAEKALLKKL